MAMIGLCVTGAGDGTTAFALVYLQPSLSIQSLYAVNPFKLLKDPTSTLCMLIFPSVCILHTQLL